MLSIFMIYIMIFQNPNQFVGSLSSDRAILAPYLSLKRGEVWNYAKKFNFSWFLAFLVSATPEKDICAKKGQHLCKEKKDVCTNLPDEN